MAETEPGGIVTGLREDRLIAQYFRPLADPFPGAGGLMDDAAVVPVPAGDDLVVTTDALIAGVHFFADDDAADIAFKALAVNVSDLAAKGAKPIAYSLALALPRGTPESWIASFAEGLGQAQTTFDIDLSGGDTAVSPAGPLMISVTAFGSVPLGKIVRRSNASAGDRLYVTGTIGDAALGLRLRQADCDAQDWPIDDMARQMLLSRYLRPQPRVALRKALLDHASAAMDISDGLAIDCSRMCAASGVSARIEATKVPISPAAQTILAHAPALLEAILTGGDDYEILAAISPAVEKSFLEAAYAAGTPVSFIGEISEAGGGLTIADSGGMPLALSRLGYDHSL